ncbi:MAG TPA: class C beta-lactamase-related serine hydrolase, partial [Candidatus Marinimicrobia bacterium]|nr:class C beta-lactamase-related serine hydrolase [Candidatus Neomarinimicrobiota bacterium]
YGIGDLEHDIEITPSSVFYIGSESKQFVAFSLLLLEEQGKLNLDDTIQKFLPDFPEYDAPLTIRHFIHHTSGVRDNLTLMYLKGRSILDNSDVDEVYELIKKQKELNFSPGEKYLYSNSCYFMLAMIIEKASGQSLKMFAQEHIFSPLGMKSTLFYDDNTDLIKNRVFSYDKNSSEDGFDNLIMRFDLVGSGGVYSNIEDLFLWDQNFYNNKLGKGDQEIIKNMHKEGLLNNGESSGYAYALNNGTYKGLKTVSHGGSLAGYRSQILRFPEEKFSVIILANRGDAAPWIKSYQVADVLLKGKFIEDSKKKENKTDTHDSSDIIEKFSLKQITGDYEIEPGYIFKFSIKNDSLQLLQSWNKGAFMLINTEGNTYVNIYDHSDQYVFSELKDNFTQKLTIIESGDEIICKRKEKVDSSSLKIEDYIGNFYSEEIDAGYLFFIEDDILKVKIANYDAKELNMSDIDTFTSDGILFRFNRSNAIIKGFELDAGRVTNLKFKKK